VADRDFHIRVRIADLKRLYRWRCGTELPDDDEGREYVGLILDHALHLSDGRNQALTFREVWAPWLDSEELATMIAARERCPRWWSPDDLGRELNLTCDDREKLGIKKIAPADMTAAEFEAYKRRRKSELQKHRRNRPDRASGQKDPRGNGVDLGERWTPRRQSIIQAIAAVDRWCTAADLKQTLTRLDCWRDPTGAVLEPKTLHRILNREVTALVEAGVIDAEAVVTRWGREGRRLRLADNKVWSAPTSCLTRAVPAPER
jgi:hypothetical protein